MIDCQDCRRSVKAYSGLLCLAGKLPRPAAYMRDYREACGPGGKLFESRADPSGDGVAPGAGSQCSKF